MAVESGLTPARALLDHRQARFAQRPLARPQDRGGSEEILDRESAAVTRRLKAAAGTRPRETVEPQVWREDKVSPSHYSIGGGGSALERARNWRTGGTIWTDGSRLDSDGVGTVCGAWRAREGWAGRPFHPGNNKEDFDAEAFAIYQALRVFEARQETS